MPKGGTSRRQRAEAAERLEEAGRLLQTGRAELALPLLRQAAEALDLPALHVWIGQCLVALERKEEARAAWQQGLVRFPGDAGLLEAAGLLRLEEGQLEGAAEYLLGACRDPESGAERLAAATYAAALAGRFADALDPAERLGALDPTPEHLLLRALCLSGVGRHAEAAALLATAEPTPEVESLRLGALLRQGPLAQLSDCPRGAVTLDGAELQAELSLREAWLALSAGRFAEAIGAAGRVEEPSWLPWAKALEALARAAAGEREVAIPVAPAGRPSAWALAAQSHLAWSRGSAPTAHALLGEAEQADPQSGPLGFGRFAREGLPVAPQQAEPAPSLAPMEAELRRLRRELERMERSRREAQGRAAEADQRARAAEEEAERAAAALEEERRSALRRELEARDAEARERTTALLGTALPAETPAPLVESLRVAEFSWQRALQSDLPAAGVAVLYCGVLERALHVLLVAPFDRWLEAAPGRRAAFLAPSRRPGRGADGWTDHFTGAFDTQHPLRAPALGELARVLTRRHLPHLELLRQYLEEERGLTPALLDALAAFVERTKVELRDPVAHGHVLEIAESSVAALRLALVESFDGGEGLLRRLALTRG